MNSNEKTLVILTPGFAKDEADTVCIPMQQSIVRRLKEKYPHVRIIIFAFQYPYERKIYSWHNNVVMAFGGRNKGGLEKLLLQRKLIRGLEKIHAVNPIDGLLSFWYGECAWVGKKFSDKTGSPHFCWMWGQDARKGNKYPRDLKLKAHELIAFSDNLQDEFEKNYGVRPLNVITPGIDSREFSRANSSKDIDIVAAGSLIPLKQFDVFVDVVAAIKKINPNVKAVLIGDGPEKNKLQSRIQDAGLTSTITLAGELAHPEVLQWMQRARTFLHPSSYEGFGIVCIEALYSGCEVISFVKPMKQEIENWHIVSNKDDMISTALGILQKPQRTFQKVIPFTIDATVEKIARLFSL